MEEKQEYRKAIEYLCTLMEQGKICQGDKFPTERSIAETLNISRNSTREALRVMESMGVMERRQGSGNYMAGNVSQSIQRMLLLMLTINSINKVEIASFRRQMEKAVCTAIMEQEDTGLERWCAGVQQLLSEKAADRETEVEQDRRFHYMLIEKTGNRLWIILMDAVMEIYREEIARVLESAGVEMKQKLQRAHMDILAGIQNRDFTRCFMAIDCHYNLIEEKGISFWEGE